MTYTWLELAVVGILVAGIAYCFLPLVQNTVDLWRHRRHLRKVFREAASRRKQRGDHVSAHWLRVHGYNRDGDKVA